MATITSKSDPSPLKPSAGSLIHLASYPSVNTIVTSNHEALKDELNGHMIFDHSTVLTKHCANPRAPEFVSASGVEALEADYPGHQWLVNQWILHREVSAGNILLIPGDPRDGYDGFIMDVELAHLTTDEIRSELPSGKARVKRGAVMTVR